jgi:hypothetical protein
MEEFIKVGNKVVTQYGTWEARGQIIEKIDDDGCHTTIYFQPEGEFKNEQERYVAMYNGSSLYHNNGQHAAGPMIYENWEAYETVLKRSDRLMKIWTIVNEMSDDDQIKLMQYLQ